MPPGKSRSLLHFVVLGPRVDATTSAAERAAVEATATASPTAPDISGLTTAEICSIRNFDVACADGQPASTTTGADEGGAEGGRGCAGAGAQTGEGRDRLGLRRGREDDRPAARATWKRPHDLAGNHAGVPRPDRVLRQGQFGFNAFEIVAADAMEQAKAADRARARGASGPAARHPDRGQEQLRHLRHGRRPTAASRSRDSSRRATRSRWPGCARRAP